MTDVVILSLHKQDLYDIDIKFKTEIFEIFKNSEASRKVLKSFYFQAK